MAYMESTASIDVLLAALGLQVAVIVVAHMRLALLSLLAASLLLRRLALGCSADIAPGGSPSSLVLLGLQPRCKCRIILDSRLRFLDLLLFGGRVHDAAEVAVTMF
jgi:hypothetical protein